LLLPALLLLPARPAAAAAAAAAAAEPACRTARFALLALLLLTSSSGQVRSGHVENHMHSQQKEDGLSGRSTHVIYAIISS
jgi:hypothetical protein